MKVLAENIDKDWSKLKLQVVRGRFMNLHSSFSRLKLYHKGSDRKRDVLMKDNEWQKVTNAVQNWGRHRTCLSVDMSPRGDMRRRYSLLDQFCEIMSRVQ